MKSRMGKLIEDAIPKNGAAKHEDKVAVAALGGMQDDTKSVEIVVERIATEIRR